VTIGTLTRIVFDHGGAVGLAEGMFPAMAYHGWSD